MTTQIKRNRVNNDYTYQIKAALHYGVIEEAWLMARGCYPPVPLLATTKENHTGARGLPCGKGLGLGLGRTLARSAAWAAIL